MRDDNPVFPMSRLGCHLVFPLDADTYRHLANRDCEAGSAAGADWCSFGRTAGDWLPLIEHRRDRLAVLTRTIMNRDLDRGDDGFVFAV
jgi:hypothetical protein